MTHLGRGTHRLGSPGGIACGHPAGKQVSIVAGERQVGDLHGPRNLDAVEQPLIGQIRRGRAAPGAGLDRDLAADLGDFRQDGGRNHFRCHRKGDLGDRHVEPEGLCDFTAGIHRGDGHTHTVAQRIGGDAEDPGFGVDRDPLAGHGEAQRSSIEIGGNVQGMFS